MKLLYILNFARRANNFSYASMMAAQELGLSFHLAGCFAYEDDAARKADEQRLGIHIHQIDFQRNPFHSGNRHAYHQLKGLMKIEQFDLVHTNTPIGGAAGRFAAYKAGIRPVIYQAHGFHFYKGAPILNWILYCPIEKMLAHITDRIITINQEDYAFAKKKLRIRRGGSVHCVAGVGISTSAYQPISGLREVTRDKLKVAEKQLLLLSIGELNQNKNHAVILRAIANLPDVVYHVAGVGPQMDALGQLAIDLGVQDRVRLLGYRDDVQALYQAADVFCHPSLREGLSVSLMEAMASGLPVVCSDIRGNRDLVQPAQGGFLVSPQDADGFAGAIATLANDTPMRRAMGAFNREHIQLFDHQAVISQMKEIYQDLLHRNQEGSLT